MSDIAADITNALQAGARAGASAASTAGRDLSGAVETFVVPQLRDIAIHVAEILQKQRTGIFSAEIARMELASQCDAVKVVVETVATLVVNEVQMIYDAIVGALGKAAGLTLL